MVVGSCWKQPPDLFIASVVQTVLARVGNQNVDSNDRLHDPQRNLERPQIF